MARQLLWFVMTILAAGISAYALLNLALPGFRSQFLQNIFALSPTAVSLHLLGGCIAMFVGAFQLSSKLRTRFLAYHRWFGRLYVIAVIVSGIAGFILALNAYGGMTSQFGFGLMAICWLGSTTIAYYHVRHGNIIEHRNWMIRSYALTLAGVTLRVYLGIATLIDVPFQQFYPVLSWICWVPNLLLVEWLVLSRLTQAKQV